MMYVVPSHIIVETLGVENLTQCGQPLKHIIARPNQKKCCNKNVESCRPRAY
ncbi:hypothetical protein DSUL_20128 [Desulfovibrionales bacterium]